MNERLSLFGAVVAVGLLVVVVLGAVGLALFAFLALCNDTLSPNQGAVRVAVTPFAVLAIYGVRLAPPWLAARARSQGATVTPTRSSAAKIVWFAFGALVLASYGCPHPTRWRRAFTLFAASSGFSSSLIARARYVR